MGAPLLSCENDNLALNYPAGLHSMLPYFSWQTFTVRARI
jgi:hypothetical protein